MGRKNVLPLILCSEKKHSYVIVGISPLGTTRGAGDLSEEDQVRFAMSSENSAGVNVCVSDSAVHVTSIFPLNFPFDDMFYSFPFTSASYQTSYEFSTVFYARCEGNTDETSV